MSNFPRRKFIVFILIGLLSIPLIRYLYPYIQSLFNRKKTAGQLRGASYKVGHLLWKIPFKKASIQHRVNVLIIGSGISGLSAARTLLQAGESDVAILELEPDAGGNARYGENEAGRFPLGAHYLPIPSVHMKELISFLKEHNVIESFDATGLPVYNEHYLCSAPEERLFIHGHWQNGLIPDFGVPDTDRAQIKSFHLHTEELKNSKGKDGLYAFDIPLRRSSADERYRMLDTITMKEYLLQHNYTSVFLHWYVDYSCKDDYGTSLEETSAWAGLHYFCSRRGKAANAEDHDVLTWPEGNGWLMNKLKDQVQATIKTNNLAYEVNKHGAEYTVTSLNVLTGEPEQWTCKQLIFACPQFVTSHIRTNIQALKNRPYKMFQYSTWMVGNISVTNGLAEKNGADLSWDNVLYNSPSLGYIHSNQQHVHRHQPEINLTYYYLFDDKKTSRKQVLAKTHADLTDIMKTDLQYVYPQLEKHLIRFDPFIWGHAMIKPVKGLIWGTERAAAGEAIHQSMYFAHTDLSGISLFEEGFYQGIDVAAQVLKDRE
ncbi:MAG: NAD(P)-binding protein [Cytophagales bacterium]|nr:NAD(P)-binding protein [Cytophaga sp.]